MGLAVERPAESNTLVPYPTLLAVGDLMRLSGSVFNLTLATVPANWILIANLASGLAGAPNTLAPNLLVAYKFAVAADVTAAQATPTGGVTVSHTFNASMWQIKAWPNVDAADPIAGFSTVANTTATATTVMPSLATGSAPAGAALDYSAANVTQPLTGTGPAGWTEDADLATGTRSYTSGHKTVNWAGGATGTVTVTWAGGTGRSLGVLLALRPKPGAGGTARRARTGGATPTIFLPPPPPPPSSDEDPNIAQASATWPAPTVDANGYPIDWQPTSMVVAAWGRPQILIGGVDVTYIDGVPTQVGGLSYLEPGGDATATLTFPGVTVFQALASTLVPWNGEQQQVEIWRIRPDGTRDGLPVFEGFTAAASEVDSASGSGYTVELIGAIFQARLAQLVPQLSSVYDIGTLVYLELNAVPGRRYSFVTNNYTDLITSDRGSLSQKVWDHVETLFAQATVAGGSNQWTLNKVGSGRVYKIRLKDRTTINWAVTAGSDGVALNLSADPSTRVNAIYGSGTTPPNGAGPWSGLLAEDPRVKPSDPAYDPTVLRVSDYVDFGEDMWFQDAAREAQARIARLSAPGYVGTITLTADPESGSRIDIRAGHNILVKAYHGVDVLLHIAAVHSEEIGGSVQLTTDSQARDYRTLRGVLDPDRSGRDPTGGGRPR